MRLFDYLDGMKSFFMDEGNAVQGIFYPQLYADKYEGRGPHYAMPEWMHASDSAWYAYAYYVRELIILAIYLSYPEAVNHARGKDIGQLSEYSDIVKQVVDMANIYVASARIPEDCLELLFISQQIELHGGKSRSRRFLRSVLKRESKQFTEDFQMLAQVDEKLKILKTQAPWEYTLGVAALNPPGPVVDMSLAAKLFLKEESRTKLLSYLKMCRGKLQHDTLFNPCLRWRKMLVALNEDLPEKRKIDWTDQDLINYFADVVFDSRPRLSNLLPLGTLNIADRLREVTIQGHAMRLSNSRLDAIRFYLYGTPINDFLRTRSVRWDTRLFRPWFTIFDGHDSKYVVEVRNDFETEKGIQTIHDLLCLTSFAFNFAYHKPHVCCGEYIENIHPKKIAECPLHETGGEYYRASESRIVDLK